MEEWKSLEFSGLPQYSISNLGRIKHNKTGCIRNLKPNHKGYIRFLGKRVHRLVAEAFIPKPDGKDEIDHINGVKDDNRVSNLRWVSHKENMNNPLVLSKFHSRQLSEEHKKKTSDSVKKYWINL